MVQVHPGPPIFQRKPKRTSEPPPVGSRLDLRRCDGCGACPLASATFSSFNDPFFYESETCPSSRKTGCESRTGCHFPSPASIEVMHQTFNLSSTEHSRGGGPLFWF